MKPVRLPASATLALPRWGLFSLCLLYILPGLFGRDPWKNEDAAGFGIMWTMAHGQWQDWLWPNIVGLPMAEEGPLTFWLGAICIQLFSPVLGDVLAARIATITFFMLGALAVWYSTYHLGRRNEAQPLKLAFGGQPEPKDFGRTLADAALLIYLGSLGLLLNSHQSSAEALNISLVALLCYTCIRYADQAGMRHAVRIGITLGALALNRGWLMPLALWLSLFLCWPWLGISIMRSSRDMLTSLLIAILVVAVWLLPAHFLQPFHSTPYSAWMNWNWAQISFPNPDSIKYFVRYGIWFFWPAWPLAAWAVYAWRRQERALHIALPMCFLATLTFLAWINPNQAESQLLPLLPAGVILAAFGLPTMKRGAINAIDWFAVMSLSICAAVIWLFWIAMQTGWPAQLAKNALKLAPGMQPQINWLAFIIALAASLGWIVLVHWRVSRNPTVLWRAVVLSSGGVILCWLLLMTLFLQWGDYRLSYISVARQVAQSLPKTSHCTETNASPAQRASLAYLGNIQFSRFGGEQCETLLLRDSIKMRDDKEIASRFRGKQWKLIWEGRRPADHDERFRLYQRIAATPISTRKE